LIRELLRCQLKSLTYTAVDGVPLEPDVSQMTMYRLISRSAPVFHNCIIFDIE